MQLRNIFVIYHSFKCSARKLEHVVGFSLENGSIGKPSSSTAEGNLPLVLKRSISPVTTHTITVLIINSLSAQPENEGRLVPCCLARVSSDPPSRMQRKNLKPKRVVDPDLINERLRGVLFLPLLYSININPF